MDSVGLVWIRIWGEENSEGIYRWCRHACMNLGFEKDVEERKNMTF